MEGDKMMTTYDNPFNPFIDFTNWWKYDMLLGHNTCGTLALFAGYDPNLPDEINELYINAAMDSMVSLEPEIYRIVSPMDYKEVIVAV